MNQRILYLCLLLSGSYQFSTAQDDTAKVSEPAAIAMTRATLAFLATDAKTYGYKKTPCQPCATYDDLQQFVEKNKLMRANELIASVQKRAAKSSPSELRAFLLKRVTEGADHGHRTKLPAFPKYQRELDSLVGSPLVALSKSVASGDPVSPAGDSSVVDASVSTQADETGQSDVSSKTQSSMLSWIPLVLSLLSLAGVVFLFLRRGQSGPPSGVDKPVIDEMSRRISDLEKNRNDLLIRVKTLERGSQPSRTTPTAQNQVRPGQPTSQYSTSVSTPPPTASPVQPTMSEPVAVVAPVSATPPANTLRSPQPTAPMLFYGRTADLGDGFSVGGLSTKPDRDTVFEIRRLDGSRAEFQVSDNPDLQRLALSDPYSYLSDTCTYAIQPRPGSRIQTERPGILSLQGEKWAIIEKAQISFQ